MKILELFAGSRSIGRVAKGHQVFSSDIEQLGDIDYVANILDFDYTVVPFVPDMIWASPPCTGFSVASIGTHWGGGHRAYEPRTATAKLGIELVKKTIKIIAHYQKLNPELVWYIENPRGVLRKLIPEILDKGLGNFWIQRTVTYCQYGDERMKPTDIWTNNFNWTPKTVCKNGGDCHISAPRGSRTGTQGRNNAYERSKIPEELCMEILAMFSPHKLTKKEI